MRVPADGCDHRLFGLVGAEFRADPFTISDIPKMQNRAELIISGSLGVLGLVQGLGNHVQETLRRVVNYVFPLL